MHVSAFGVSGHVRFVTVRADTLGRRVVIVISTTRLSTMRRSAKLRHGSPPAVGLEFPDGIRRDRLKYRRGTSPETPIEETCGANVGPSREVTLGRSQGPAAHTNSSLTVLAIRSPGASLRGEPSIAPIQVESTVVRAELCHRSDYLRPRPKTHLSWTVSARTILTNSIKNIFRKVVGRRKKVDLPEVTRFNVRIDEIVVVYTSSCQHIRRV
jgi:hypothetical protein